MVIIIMIIIIMIIIIMIINDDGDGDLYDHYWDEEMNDYYLHI